jgi:hypothetical protein
MIVKDIEDGLSNFPEDTEVVFEVDGKPVELTSMEYTVSAPIERGDLRLPTSIVVVRLHGTIQR